MSIHDLRCRFQIFWGYVLGCGRVLERFMELQSSKNCVRMCGGGSAASIRHTGWTMAMAFRSSGRSLLLMSEVALQRRSTCSVESRGAWQRTQAGLRWGWSSDSLSLVRKSFVKNLRWMQSFLVAFVVVILWRTT